MKDLFVVIMIIVIGFCSVEDSQTSIHKSQNKVIVESKDYTNKENLMSKLLGKWKFTKRIAYPRAYSMEGQNDSDKKFLKREIEFQKEFFKGKTFEINTPFYNLIKVEEPYSAYFQGEGYNVSKELNKYLKGKNFYIIEILFSEPTLDANNQNLELGESYGYDNFESEQYDAHDIWSLIVVNEETMIFCQSGCYEVKKQSA